MGWYLFWWYQLCFFGSERFIESYYPLIDKFSLKGKAVREICQDTIGNIWIGTEDAGLNCFNPETKTMIPMDIGLDHYNVHGMKIIGDEIVYRSVFWWT